MNIYRGNNVLSNVLHLFSLGVSEIVNNIIWYSFQSESFPHHHPHPLFLNISCCLSHFQRQLWPSSFPNRWSGLSNSINELWLLFMCPLKRVAQEHFVVSRINMGAGGDWWSIDWLIHLNGRVVVVVVIILVSFVFFVYRILAVQFPHFLHHYSNPITNSFVTMGNISNTLSVSFPERYLSYYKTRDIKSFFYSFPKKLDHLLRFGQCPIDPHTLCIPPLSF